ncbi:MAG: hypothetical protein AABW83_03425 [Nanoarchaeota archaeon]
MDAVEIHKKIINLLNEKGPSLPINIAKSVGITSLFVSAFLSELVNQNDIRVSNLKVGGSPLYYIEGQQKKLENYYKYLHPREAEAYMLLKQHKVLKDNDQDPVIRVALRSIKDFSYGFKIGDEIYWKFFSVSEEELNEIFNGKQEDKKLEEENQEKKDKNVEEKNEVKIDKKTEENVNDNIEIEIKTKEDNLIKSLRKKSIVKVKEKIEESFNNPLIIKDEDKKEKTKSDFVKKVLSFLESKGIKIVEEKDYKNKEYNCIVQIKSELGPVNFFTQAKDKKLISEDDFKKLLSDAQSVPLPAFMIYTGEITNKAKIYLNNYISILKAKKIV